MYLYICVFLIYPTFVGSECNKVIVIVIVTTWAECGTVYGDMHLKYLLGSIVNYI